MSAEVTASIRRHALGVTAIYLLIRGLPDLTLFVLTSLLPADTLYALMAQHPVWMQRLLATLPLRPPFVPPGFHSALACVIPVLLETLLVYLASVWFLRRNEIGLLPRRIWPWLALVLTILLWSTLLRYALLYHFLAFQMEALVPLRQAPDCPDGLMPFLIRAQWTFSALMYASAPLWALVPVYLHVRFAQTGKPAVSHPSPDDRFEPTLVRGVSMAAFLLGFLAIHALLLQAVLMGLWPWLIDATGLWLSDDTVHAMAPPLTFGQILFTPLAGALAAYVYARRRPPRPLQGPGAFITPVLNGVLAYLSTTLVLLALAWVASLGLPGIVEATLRNLESGLRGSLPLLITLNALGLIVLCLASHQLGHAPRRWVALTVALAGCFAVPAYVGGMLAAVSHGKVGERPRETVTGTLGDVRWGHMAQACTGVLETRHDTWLIGRSDAWYVPPGYVPAGTQNLADLLPSGHSADQGRHGRQSRTPVTTLARLQEDGSFQLVAIVPEVACLLVSPSDDTLYLLTGLHVETGSPEPSSSTAAVFRSVDHGVNWEWLRAGFMHDTGQQGWQPEPVFGPGQDVWAWHGIDLPPLASSTALYYSRDLGQTSMRIPLPEPLIAPLPYLTQLTGVPAQSLSESHDSDRHHFVVQPSATRAYAWVSETIAYRNNDERRHLPLYSRIVLTRDAPGDAWRVDELKRVPHERLTHAATAADGRTYAILHTTKGQWLARLDNASGDWVDRQPLPMLLPAWLARQTWVVRGFWNNGDYQVIRLGGDIVVPRLLLPFVEQRAEFTVDAHYYSRDGGRTWHQLAIPDGSGVMGLSRQGSKLYWSPGNSSGNDEAVLRHFDLAQ